MTTKSGEVSGLSILVTGGGTGIGAGVATELAARGAWVTICGRTRCRSSPGAQAALSWGCPRSPGT